MKKLLLATLICACTTPVFAADKPTLLSSTTADIGRPYTVIDTVCFFQTNTNFISKSYASMFQSAIDAAGKVIDATGKKIGADGLVGMQVTPLLIPSPVNPGDLISNSGVFICGTWVRFK